MDDRVFRRVQRYGWDLATDSYDRGWVPVIERLSLGCIDRARPQPGEAVLDIATGPGVLALEAARAVEVRTERDGTPNGRVLGIDISEKMVALAARRAQEAGLAHLRFERRDMEQTGAPEAAFDVVTCAFGFMFAANRSVALLEVARVTRRGGRLSACVWGRRGACGWAEIFSIVDRHVASEVCPLFFALGVPGAFAAGLEPAGFVDVREERVSVSLHWASADEACAAMIEGGAVALAWSKFSAETRAAVRAAYLDSIERYRVDGGGFEIPSEVAYVTARRGEGMKSEPEPERIEGESRRSRPAS